MIFGESGEVFLGRDYGHAKDYSEETAAQIDNEVKHIIDSAYKKTVQLVRDNRTKLDKLTETLLEKEKVEAEEFEEIFAKFVMIIKLNNLSREVEGDGPMKPSNHPYGKGANSGGETRKMRKTNQASSLEEALVFCF